MTIPELQQKIYELLKPSGWGQKLKLFLLSEDFAQIIDTLRQESEDGHKFTPIVKNMFNAFIQCPYNDLKVVMLNQDPYLEAGASDGMAFSCSNFDKEHKILKCIFDEIERTVYPSTAPNDHIPREEYDKNLTRWANQGILLLNVPLTCQVGIPEKHIKLWEPFFTYLFQILSDYNTGIVYVYFGKKVTVWSKNTTAQNYKFFCIHPLNGVLDKEQKWNSNDLFNNINKILFSLYNEKITW
jgi:uracil-DNA glycosylase